MATLTKFQDFSEQLTKGKHQFGTDAFKVMLTNTAPVAATDTIKANITDISAGNGYTAGGASVTVAESESGGTTTVTATSASWTASGGTIGPFRYAVLYNDTQTSPAKPLVASVDYGSAVTVADGDTFTVLFNNASPGTAFTVV